MYGQQKIESNVYAPATNWTSIGQNDWPTQNYINNTFSYQQQHQQYVNVYYPQVHIQAPIATKSHESNSFHSSAPTPYQTPDVCHSHNENSSQEGVTDLSELSDSNHCKRESEEKASPLAKSASDIPVYFTTQKIVNNTAKLSYTVYQLELLNAIYVDMKYPNSVQKTLIGKLIGITRDQVKIWFQNRRRKDTLVSQGKMPSNATAPKAGNKRRRSSDESENNEDDFLCSSLECAKKVVEDEVINNVLHQLKAHHNAPSRLSSKRTKLCQESPEEATPIANDTNRIILTFPQESTKPVASEPSIKTEYSSNLNGTRDSNYPSLNGTTSILTPVSCSGSSSSSGSTSSSEDDVQYIGHHHHTQHAKLSVMPHSFSIQDYIGNRYLASHSKSATVHNQYRPYVVHDATKLNSWAYTIPASLCQQTASGYYESASEHLTAAAGCDVGGDYKYGYASPTAAYDYASGQYVQAVTEQSYHKYASVANADVYYNSFA